MLYLIALPLLIYLSFKKKYRQSIPSRFFLFNNSRFSENNGIWFHLCSISEAKALEPILDLLHDKDIKITTITHAGQVQALKYNTEVRYLPYEMFLPFWIKKQKILVVLESEFWYLLFAVSVFKGTKVVLLNARISEKNINRYLQFAWFYKKLLDNVEVIYAQSEADKNRFLALGAKNIEVTGNIKLAQNISKTNEYEKPDKECIVGANTHDFDEEAILKSFIEYKKQSDSRLVIVPMDPERFDLVYKLMQNYADKNSLTLSRFSQISEFKSDMVLVDVIGELNNIYAISDIAILGGAFRDDCGGHNPLEPAHFGCKIITGKNFYNQKELFKYVHHVQYVQSDEIHKALIACKDLPVSLVEDRINLDPIIKKISQV